MIEVIKYKPVNKNALVGILDIKIPKWGNFIIRDISYFQKGNQRWVSMPARAYEKDGEKKYYVYNLFEDINVMKKFQENIIEALGIYFRKNPEQAPLFP